MSIRRSISLQFFILIFPIISISPCFGEIIHVPVDQPSITAAMGVATNGDEVLVAPGTYFEHDIQLAPGVSLRSENGAEQTIIDAQHSGSCLLGAEGATVQGFTIQNSGTLNTAGIWCYEVSVDILDNIFDGHQDRVIVLYKSHGDIRGNVIHTDYTLFVDGIYCSQSGPLITQNTIFASDPWGNMDAISLQYAHPEDPRGATVVDNLIYGRVGLGHTRPSTHTIIERNLIYTQNGYSSGINAAWCQGTTEIVNNTIIDGNGIFLQGDSSANIRRNIFAYTQSGIQNWGGGTVVSECNNIWPEDIFHQSFTGPTDFSADPCFCSFDLEDFRLCTDSVSRAGSHPWGCNESDIGAFGPGCGDCGCPGAVPTEQFSWGRVKALFR